MISAGPGVESDGAFAESDGAFDGGFGLVDVNTGSRCNGQNKKCCNTNTHVKVFEKFLL